MKKITLSLLAALGVIVGGLFAAAPASAAESRPAVVVKAADCTGTAVFKLTTNSQEHARVPTIGTSKNCTLRAGNVSSAVRELQNSLVACHGKNITVDGDFGPATRTALAQVQSSLGLVADGIYGPQTYSKMKFKNSINLACSPGSQISNTLW
ncbi:peptidoglycan-binding protein [Microbacterium sp. NPDC057944]|uniref:peptidoglycan-binding domain-containing protein n=1 Tax=Microbacterium sp. NPDC057944 TaxID=3346286 RepID=UPI0036DEFC3D